MHNENQKKGTVTSIVDVKVIAFYPFEHPSREDSQNKFFRFMFCLCLPYTMTVVIILNTPILMHNPPWLCSER